MKVYTDNLHKIAYATDASVYREIPYGVAYPATVEDVQELMRLVREKGIDLIPRAGGTSLAGQVVGSGLVVDISKHWNKILEIRAEERWARVQPGVVRDKIEGFQDEWNAKGWAFHSTDDIIKALQENPDYQLSFR